MSLLPNITYANINTPLFLLANVSSLNVNTISTTLIQAATANVSSLYANYISSADVEVSSIFATVLDLDGQVITANPTELLLNGIPIATSSNLSTLADWSLDPAISSINANNNDILNANIGYFQTLSTTNIRATNILVDNILAKNIFALSTYTSTISSVAEIVDFAFIDHLSAGQAYIGNLSSISIDTQFLNVSSLTAVASYFSTISADTGNFSTINVSSINGNEFTTSSITTSTISVNVLGVSSLVATSISSIGAEIRQALMSSIVFSPSLNPSLGGVSVDLGLGGLLGNVVGWGAGVFGAAAGTVGLVTGATALYQGRQSQTFNNTNYELVNGTTQLQISTLGESFSTIYRFNNSVDPSSVPGEEIFISTIYSPGLAIRSMSDPLYTLSTPQSTIQSFGQWVSLGDTLDVVDWAEFPAVSTIQGANNDMISVRNADISTISTAIIYGANPDVFGVFGIPGLKIEAQNVFLSTPQVVHPGFFNGSTIGANLVQAPTLSTNLILCSTGAILTNGLSAQVVETQSLTINSSIFSTSTTAGTQAQPAGRLILDGTDLDMGQNDLWAQQVRIGAANTGIAPELVLYQPDNGTKQFSVQSGDRTTRTFTSALGTGNPGYLLDTFVNPPFFSTLNQSTALLAFFPSTNSGTIGISTISVIPPAPAASFFSRSTQSVAINTPLVLYHEVAGASVGNSITQSTTAIVIGETGVYNVETSIQLDKPGGGTEIADFWFRKNGIDIPDSASQITIQGSTGEVLANVSIFEAFAAGDKLEVILASPDAAVGATFFQSTVTTPYTRPAIPSVITNIKRLN